MPPIEPPADGDGDEERGETSELQVGRRLHSRLRVYLPATLTSVFGIQRVHLQNVSRGGLKLRWNQAVKRGSDVVVAWADYELFGSVVWAHPQYGGVALDVALPQRVILAMRSQEAAPDTTASRDTTAWFLENLRYHEGRIRRA